MPTLRPIAFAAILLLAASASAQQERRPYIVQLQDQPAASYAGGIAGLAATRPAAGASFQSRSVNVQNYLQYLGARKADVLATISGAPVIAQYDVVLNGFAVMLTDDEVLLLKNNAAVADIQADQVRHLDTISTPRFLGLTAAGGLWSQYAGGTLVKGENLVIGIVDGGIWPENKAFADRVDSNGMPTFDTSGTLAYGPPPDSFKGGCVSGEGFDPVKHCNNKLVGAKYFNAGFLSSGLVKNWSEYYSPRDSNIGTDGTTTGHGGHGDHTASTAAGNANNPLVLGGSLLGPASGIAPRARVAAYKICWTFNDSGATDGTGATNSCFASDLIAGIDEAVKDGVNVINYSISGARNNTSDPVEQSFYKAALANVFVAASAGNDGPGTAVAHASPWITTVAASTHDRNLTAQVTLGNNAVYTGASVNATALPATALVRAEEAALGGGAANLCYSDATAAAHDPSGVQVLLDPAKVNGKVVICTRGNNARTDKSLAVAQAGGVGMILVDNGSGPVAETHSVPTVHLSIADGNAVKNYAVAAGAGATAAIGTFTIGTKPAPVMAVFSSRGPNGADANILKPDLTAPGVDVLASVTPALTPAQHAAVAAGTLVPGQEFASYQGTSMSSPHVAGLALLLRQAHPTWSPAAIKSAMMTSAYDTIGDTAPYSQGAGHIDPNKAVDPGLVYDAGVADYASYQCKVNRASVTADDCTAYGTLDDTYNLNQPAITVGGHVAPTVVKRRVTNVGASSATYTGSATVPGFTAVVAPNSLTLAPGATASFTVTLSRTTAATLAWNFGALTWTDGNHVVRSPLQVRAAKPITAPEELTSDKTAGSKLFVLKAGFTGRITAVKAGLKDVEMGPAVTLAEGGLDSAPLQAACVAGTDQASVKVYPVTIPAGALVARFALRQADTSAAGDDNDMGVLAPDGSWIYSGNGGSNESVQLLSPAAGDYKVCVTAWAGSAAMTHKLSSWVVTPADVGGNLDVVLPGRVVIGNNASASMSWSGLAAGHRYLGAAQFLDVGGVPQAVTALRIETGAAAVPAATSERAVTPKSAQ